MGHLINPVSFRLGYARNWGFSAPLIESKLQYNYLNFKFQNLTKFFERLFRKKIFTRKLSIIFSHLKLISGKNRDVILLYFFDGPILSKISTYYKVLKKRKLIWKILLKLSKLYSKVYFKTLLKKKIFFFFRHLKYREKSFYFIYTYFRKKLLFLVNNSVFNLLLQNFQYFKNNKKIFLLFLKIVNLIYNLFNSFSQTNIYNFFNFIFKFLNFLFILLNFLNIIKSSFLHKKSKNYKFLNLMTNIDNNGFLFLNNLFFNIILKNFYYLNFYSFFFLSSRSFIYSLILSSKFINSISFIKFLMSKIKNFFFKSQKRRFLMLDSFLKFNFFHNFYFFMFVKILFKNLKLNKFLNLNSKNNKTIIYFKRVKKIDINSSIIARYICIRLKQKFKLKAILNPIVKDLLKNKFVNGFSISCRGRFSKKEIAAYVFEKRGKLSLNTVKCIIDYAYQTVILKYSICGIKVWIQRKFKRFINKKKNYLFFRRHGLYKKISRFELKNKLVLESKKKKSSSKKRKKKGLNLSKKIFSVSKFSSFSTILNFKTFLNPNFIKFLVNKKIKIFKNFGKKKNNKKKFKLKKNYDIIECFKFKKFNLFDAKVNNYNPHIIIESLNFNNYLRIKKQKIFKLKKLDNNKNKKFKSSNYYTKYEKLENSDEKKINKIIKSKNFNILKTNLKFKMKQIKKIKTNDTNKINRLILKKKERLKLNFLTYKLKIRSFIKIFLLNFYKKILLKLNVIKFLNLNNYLNFENFKDFFFVIFKKFRKLNFLKKLYFLSFSKNNQLFQNTKLNFKLKLWNKINLNNLVNDQLLKSNNYLNLFKNILKLKVLFQKTFFDLRLILSKLKYLMFSINFFLNQKVLIIKFKSRLKKKKIKRRKNKKFQFVFQYVEFNNLIQNFYLMNMNSNKFICISVKNKQLFFFKCIQNKFFFFNFKKLIHYYLNNFFKISKFYIKKKKFKRRIIYLIRKLKKKIIKKIQFNVKLKKKKRNLGIKKINFIKKKYNRNNKPNKEKKSLFKLKFKLLMNNKHFFFKKNVFFKRLSLKKSKKKKINYKLNHFKIKNISLRLLIYKYLFKFLFKRFTKLINFRKFLKKKKINLIFFFFKTYLKLKKKGSNLKKLKHQNKKIFINFFNFLKIYKLVKHLILDYNDKLLKFEKIKKLIFQYDKFYSLRSDFFKDKKIKKKINKLKKRKKKISTKKNDLPFKSRLDYYEYIFNVHNKYSN